MENATWRKWSAGIVRHAALPMLAAAVLAIGLMGASVYGEKEKSTFYIKDIAGDRKALENVVISGELVDGYHRERFEIKDGTVQTRSEVHSQPEWPDLYRYSSGGYKRIGDLEFEIHGLHSFELFARKTPYGAYWGTSSPATPGLVFPSGSTENSATFTNALEYGIAGIGDKVYFTPTITWEYGGSTAIYEWPRSSFTATGDPSNLPAARKVAEWKLATAEEDPEQAMDVLGLESVGDRLALVAIQNGSLVVRGYDSLTGKLAGVALVPGITIGHRGAGGENQADGDSGLEGVSEPYLAFSDSEAGTLTLAFYKSAMQAGTWAMETVSFQFTDSGVSLAQTIDEVYADYEQDNYFGQAALDYRDGKLIAVRTVRDKRPSEDDYVHDQALPRHFLIAVYKDGQTLYKGELMTDLNEDTNALLNETNFQIDSMKYRHFANLVIRGGGEGEAE